MTCTLHVARDDRLTDYHFGPGHRLAPVRVELTMRLAHEFGLWSQPGVTVAAPSPASDADLELVRARARARAGAWCGAHSREETMETIKREETMETIKDLVGSHPFFAGLSPSAVELIAGCASNVHFAQGDRIFDQGDPASLFYVIRHGRVALEAHSPAKGPLVIDTMDEGEVLGWSWLVAPYRYFFDARAVTPVSATAVDGACLRGKCEADAELGYQLLKRVTTVMYDRLQSSRIRLLDLYG